jgi:hypothetical protein
MGNYTEPQIQWGYATPLSMFSRTAFRNIPTEGNGWSLPDSSLNTLHDIPGISPGRISTSLINTVGEPIMPIFFASDSLIL